jgi:hypothetical protein
MTIKEKFIHCPNCGAKIKIRYIGSYYISSLRSDLAGFRPNINDCEKCKYVFFDEDLKPNKEFIASDEYKKIYEKYYEWYPFYVIYQIYLNLKLDDKKINTVLLYDHYSRNAFGEKDLFSLKILAQRLEKKKNPIHQKDKYLIGEYYRLSRNFKKSESIFKELLQDKDLKDNLKNMIFCQLNLIINKKSNLFYKCSEFKQNIPILDDKDFDVKDIKNSEDIVDELANFIQDLLHSNRQSEFKKGLLRYQKLGIDLNTIDKDGDNLLSYLLLYDNFRTCKLNKQISSLFKMVEIAIKDFNINPFIIAGLVCDAELGYTIISELFMDMDINGKSFDCFLDKLRRLLFEYSLNLIKTKKVNKLTQDEKFAAILLQLPNYKNIKTLFDNGFAFEIDLVKDEFKNERYDIFSYLDSYLLSIRKDVEAKFELLCFIAKHLTYKEHIKSILETIKSDDEDYRYYCLEGLTQDEIDVIVEILSNRVVR